MTNSSECRLDGSLELEIDIDRVRAAAAQSRRRGIDLQHAMRRSHHRVVHDDISAGLYNFDARNPSVGLDTNLKGANEGLGRVENRCRLIPLAVKAVMDERVIPPEVGGSSASAGLPGSSATGLPGAGTHCLRRSHGGRSRSLSRGRTLLFR